MGNDEEVSIRRVAELVAELPGGSGVRMGRSSDPDYLSDNLSRRCPDLRKTKAAIAWVAEVPLRLGLAHPPAHYRKRAGE